MEYWVFDESTAAVVIKLKHGCIFLYDKRDLLQFGRRDIHELSIHQIKVAEDICEPTAKDYTSMVALIIEKEIWNGAMGRLSEIDPTDLGPNKALTKAASKISLTTDCWKSSHQKIDYMVITAHFVDHNWRLQKRVLSFVHVPPPRTVVDIADGIYKCLQEWEIKDKIFTISVDNATYNDKALRRLKETFSRVRKLSCGGRLFHIRCCAHILNLLVKDGLAIIDHIIDDVGEGIKYINNSEGRRLNFSKAAHQMQMRDWKLMLDVPTRWNSTYNMLCMALKFKDAFPRYAEYEPHFHHLPTNEDLENVQSVCEILKVFKVYMNIISGSDYPTVNLYLIENDFICDMVKKMKEKFDNFWDENIKEVKNALYEMYLEYLEMHDTLVRESTAHGSEHEINALGLNEGTSLGFGWEAFGEFIKIVHLERLEKSELDMYLEEDDFCHFTWVSFLSNKVGIADLIKNFIVMIENPTNNRVKAMRTDNGTEFKNAVHDHFCTGKGIVRQFSVVHTPQQNGVAERRNRTLKDAARTMLCDSKLPVFFWAETINMACYV
ncbi:zinc finger BED domain-containing protein RICESLEEPER 2-like [Lactuca sativa]|uniref:zinc finger BED domain-containing protein RICESLEEPER 2-like n=1 Tax=Lactuca sativa TaxID=4236 RepID=UPI0022B00354|nr:zinc finger BED domain-containing protein RICESLEEPER 2-like [Lactuca sativa]